MREAGTLAWMRAARSSQKWWLVLLSVSCGCALPHAALRVDARADRQTTADAELDSGIVTEDTGVAEDAPSVDDSSVDARVDTGADTGVDTGIAVDVPNPPPDVPCGRGGQMCCGATCNAPLQCVGGTCRACGGAAQACCPGSMCSAGLACEEGTCRACGRSGEPCCGITCASGFSCVAFGAFSICVDASGCGSLWQPCCLGSCRSGQCVRGAVCGACGGDGEPCLPGTCECRDGRTCNASQRCR